MTDEFKDIGNPISGEPLSDTERAAMRSQLRIYMAEHPARVPFSMRISDAFSSLLSPSHVALQFASAAVALVAVAGTGTAYAAGNSLPGNPLYTVKTDLEEPLQGAFAVTAQAQAAWNAQLAARRLSEAEQLAAKNQLTPAAESAVASGLDQATENFDANVAQLATSSGNAATAANLESNMEATLSANTQVLSAIQTAVPSAAHSIQPLLARVRTRAAAVSTARTQLDIAAGNASTTVVKAAAEQQLNVAEGQLSGSASIAAAATSSTSSASVSQTAIAQRSIQAGQQNLNEGDYGAALETLQTAAVAAQEANIDASAVSQIENVAGVELPVGTSTAAVSTTTQSATSTPVTAATTTAATSTATSTRDSDQAPDPKTQ